MYILSHQVCTYYIHIYIYIYIYKHSGQIDIGNYYLDSKQNEAGFEYLFSWLDTVMREIKAQLIVVKKDNLSLYLIVSCELYTVLSYLSICFFKMHRNGQDIFSMYIPFCVQICVMGSLYALSPTSKWTHNLLIRSLAHFSYCTSDLQ